MSEQSERIERILKAKRQRDQEHANAEEESRPIELKETAAADLWTKDQPELMAAIGDVNEQIKNDGLALGYNPVHQQKESVPFGRPAIKLEIILRENDKFYDRKLIVGMFSRGNVHVYIGTMDLSTKTHEFETSQADKDLWVDIILDFIEKAQAGGLPKRDFLD